MALVRLIYASAPTQEPSWGVVRDILSVSERNNDGAGITGLLLLTGGRYLQVLEGSSNAVSSLFLRIAGDPRHSEVELMLFAPVMCRLFDDWAMHGAYIADRGDALPASSLVAKYGVHGDGLALPSDPDRSLALLLDARHLLRSLP